MSTTTASTTTSPRSNGLTTRSKHDHSTWIGNGDVAVGQRDLDHPQLRSAAVAGVGDADQAVPLAAVVGPELVRTSTKEHRDGHVPWGMEAGMQQTFDRLEDLLDRADTHAERFRRVAAGFADRVAHVPDGAWDNSAPCEGWTARDVVRHLIEWV